MTDLMEAMVALLKADTAVSDLVGTRVFGSRIPSKEVGSQPRKTVALRRFPATEPFGSNDFLDFTVQGFDIFNYGETEFEADRVRRAVHDAIKGIDRKLQGQVLIHSAGQSGSARDFIDPDFNWPVVLESWVVRAGESAVV